MLSLSKRQIFRLNSCAKIPAPIRIGGAVRWRVDEIRCWIKAGAPDRKTWKQIRGGRKMKVAKAKTTSPDAAGSGRQSIAGLDDEIGLLLWVLQGELSPEERREGYQRLEVLLSRKYGAGMQ